MFLETRKRALNFVTDLLEEGNYCLEQEKNENLVKTQQEEEQLDSDCQELYQLLQTSLNTSGWCDVISDSISLIPGFDISDQVQTVEAVTSSLSLCGDRVIKYIPILKHLYAKLQQFQDNDWKDEMNVVENCVKLLQEQEQNYKTGKKVEL